MSLFNTSLQLLGGGIAYARSISHNIANANTNGFKQNLTQFVESSALNLAQSAVSSGVEVDSHLKDFTVGTILFTGRQLDLSISESDHFFIIRDQIKGERLYTRAGRFDMDSDGFIVNSEARRLQGFAINDGITADNLTDLRIPSSAVRAEPTTTIDFQINLDARQFIPSESFDPNKPESYNFKVDATAHDSLGVEHLVSTFFVKAADNQFTAHVLVDDINIGHGTINFFNDGSFSNSTGLDNLNFDPATGASNPQTIRLDFTDSTQFGLINETITIDQNGLPAGLVSDITINSDGIITAQLDNGAQKNIAQIALAEFASPQGLAATGNMAYKETATSGDATINRDYSTGVFRPQTLESSNVDLITQLVNLTQALRFTQMGAKLTQTNADIMDAILKIHKD